MLSISGKGRSENEMNINGGLGENFEIAEKFHRMRQLMTHLPSKLGVSHSEFCTMNIIIESDSSDGIAVSAIAAALDVTPPAVSRMLKSLEERGLIERHVNAFNRRSTMVRLTENGEKLLDVAHERFIGMMHCISDKMGSEQLREFNLLYDEILNIMSDYIYNKEVGIDDKNA